jgi:hypothetical protein
MTKTKVIRLNTLKALSEMENVTGDYLRKLMVRIRKGELSEWRDWRFVSLGSGNRAAWLAYKGDYEIEINEGEPEEPTE